MKIRLNTWQKLFLGFIIVVIIPILIAGNVAIRLFHTGVEQQAEITLNKDLNAARNILYQRLDNIHFYVTFLSQHRELREMNLSHDEGLQRLLVELKEQRGLSFLNLVDPSGSVIAGANRKNSTQLNAEVNELIQNALLGQTSKGVVVLDEHFLKAEGLHEQAHFELIDSPEARETIKKEESRGLSFAAASPIYNNEGDVIAVLLGGDLLNREHRFIDEISELLEVTATLFLDDLRIATSIRLRSGDRAYGTRVSEEVANIVLDQSERYLGRAYIIDDWYLTAYEPIHDIHDNVVGILYVGIPEAPFSLMRRETVQHFLIIAALSAGIAVLIAYFITQSIRKPIKKMMSAMKSVELGDLSQRFDGYTPEISKKDTSSTDFIAVSKSKETPTHFSGDEIQQLGNFFNEMMESLQANWEKNRELQNKLEEKEKMRVHLLQKIIVSQEEERKRISRELHDETGQSLTSLLLGLKLIQQADSTEKAKELTKNLREIIYKTIEEIQWLSYELRPSALDDLGLEVALRRYVSELSQHAKINIELKMVNCKGMRFSSIVETTIYRVVQEGLTNVIKHAKANNVKVLVHCSARSMDVKIEDDGVGFDIHDIEDDQQKSLGLFGMKERAFLIGGNLVIESAPGKGTRISLKIPFDEIEGLSYS